MRVGRIFWAAGTVAALTLSGCGGGTAKVTQNSVTGVVADGYLEHAKVFLDLNDDKLYTPGEPTAWTDADGGYTLTGVSAADLRNHAIVVLAEKNTTINHEGSTSTPVSDAYVLSTPPDAPKTAEGKVVITPLTTLIHNQIETNPALSVTAAEAAVKSNLGVAPATSLFDDFVQKKGVSDDYDKLSKVSQVVATAIGNNMTAIQQAAPTANLNDVIKVIVAEVISQLATISTQVDTAGTFSATDIATSTVNIDTSSQAAVDALKDNLTQAGTTTVVSSFQTALGTDGFFSIDRENFSQSQYAYYYGVVKLGASGTNGYALTEDNFTYTYFNPTWTATTNSNNDYALTSSGWGSYDDSASAGTLVFNSDGTATWTLKASGVKQVISVSKIDVAGKPIKMFVKDVSVTTDATFPVGSEAYKMTFIPQSDTYKVWMSGTNYDLTGVASVADMVSHFAVGSDIMLHLGSSMNNTSFGVKFAGSGTSGTAQFYVQNYMTGGQVEQLAMAGTWKIVEPVTSYPVLVLDVPFAYKSQYMSDNPARGIIFALVEGAIRQGGVEYAMVPRDDKGVNFNKTAFTAIKDNFAPVWFTGSPKLAKTAKAAKAAKKFRML
ncbi:hypothetical protein GMST_09430 [Geomonas silvestris]|uniref:Lipoprotein n=1 Tax=Geomonas silvestris TaxID=2740184 RepID=A0A6V8MF40_9BACT|nr:hypothetical protein [Geomonas silvestris]GFO58618.1 hypothetical protein GMST_09430 [Geomonas silvestris]